MKLASFVLTISLLLVTSSALAAPANDPSAQPTSAKPGDRVVCRTEEEMGSRLKTKKTCLTVDQWEKVSRDQADSLDRRLRTPHSESAG